MAAEGSQPLLSEKHYDDAAQIVTSDSESDLNSMSGDNDDFTTPLQSDRRILDEAEDEANFLQKQTRLDGVRKIFGRPQTDVETERRIRKINRRTKQFKDQAEGSGNAELMYEMEEGYKDTSSRNSTESLPLKQREWKSELPQRKPYFKILIGSIFVAVVFILLTLGASRVSQRYKSGQTFTNGTHTFGPTTILISLDGFRADFLHRGLTPAMSAFVASGVSPTYMLPSFPSLTFPNHFTLVTGLYPESHGVVSNQFWDPELQEEFYYTNITSSMQPKWWNAEPIWVTAEKEGMKTAIHMWPGSEAHISHMDPTYLDKYNGTEVLENKVDRILHWLDLPQEDRPQFIGAYVPNVDADGHLYGPNSTKIRGTIVDVDSMLTLLVEGLYTRNLTEVVNMVIVSDHGMATTSVDRLVQLDDLIDLSLVDHIDGWPLQGLRLKDPDRNVPILYAQLQEASKSGAFEVYTPETMPERYHFSNNDRIAPLWMIPKTGWGIVDKATFDIAEAQASGLPFNPKGMHGYDHEHPLMRAIFIARGPAFPHTPNSRIAPFQNIELYNIICDSLGLEPHPNNGTLRLPFKTEGLHSDFEGLPDIPADPIDGEQPTSTSANTEIATLTSGTSTSTSIPVTATPSAVDDQPEDKSDNSDDSNPKSKWWKFLHDQIQKAKEWAKQFVDSINKNKPGADDGKIT